VNALRDVSDPTSGQRWVFTRTGGETNGELLEAELYISPGGFVRSHIHPTQEETFTGVEGTFVLDIAGETRALGPGETVVIPAGTPHGFRNAREAAKVQVTVRPALALDNYFRAYLGLSRDGRIRLPASGIPTGLLQIALVMDRYAPEIAAPRIPLGIQRPFWRILAKLGRKAGRGASFPEYGAP
jgi:quercetin dioxygenase-like cupin family protein